MAEGTQTTARSARTTQAGGAPPCRAEWGSDARVGEGIRVCRRYGLGQGRVGSMAGITIYPLENYKIDKKDGKPSKGGEVLWPAASLSKLENGLGAPTHA